MATTDVLTTDTLTQKLQSEKAFREIKKHSFFMGMSSTAGGNVVKVKEEKLTMLYEHDSSLLADVENINSAFLELETNSASNLDTKESVSKISAALDNILLKFESRENLLREFN